MNRLNAIATHIGGTVPPPSMAPAAADAPYEDEHRIPIVVGVGRVTMHPRKGKDGGFTPVSLMQEALAIALNDTGVAKESVLSEIDSMGMPGFNMAGETNNPPWLLAKKMGIELLPGRDCNTGQGSSGQLYMCQFAQDIADGVETGIALVAQGEARHSLRQARKAGENSLPHDEDAPARPTQLRIVDGMGVRRVGEEEMQRQEARHGLSAPNWAYPVYDNAMRAAVRERHAFLKHRFLMQNDHLPRQARDKRSEKLKQRGASAGWALDRRPSALHRPDLF